MAFRWIAFALLALVLVVPSAASAQGAGDDQYQDPFGDEPAEEQPAPAPAEPEEPAATPEPAAPEAAPPAQPAQATPSPTQGGGGQLPYTGVETGLLALAGGLLLASGLALRRRWS